MLLKLFANYTRNIVKHAKFTVTRIFVTTVISFLVQFLSLKIYKPYISFFSNLKSNSFLAKILAVIIGKHSFHIFKLNKNELSNIIKFYELLSESFLYNNFILYGLLTHFYIETKSFEKLQNLLQNAVLYHVNNHNKQSTKNLQILLRHLYCTDQFLFNFGRFSLNTSTVRVLNFHIEELLSSSTKQNKFTKLFRQLFEEYTKFIIHQDELQGVEIISKILAKAEENRHIFYGMHICVILLNNTITREKQMKKRIELAELYATKFKFILENEVSNIPNAELLNIVNSQLLYNLMVLNEIIGCTQKILKYCDLLIENLAFNFQKLSLTQLRLYIQVLIKKQNLNSDNSKNYLLKAQKHFKLLINSNSAKKIHHIKLGCKFFALLLKQEDFHYAFNKIPKAAYDYDFLMLCSDFYIRLENFTKSINLAEEAIKLLEYQFLIQPNPVYLLKYRSFKDDLGRKKFYKHSTEILRKVPQPQNPKKVLFVVANDHQNTLAMGIPIFCELKKRGCAIVYLGQGVLGFEPTGNKDIDKFYGIIGNTYNYLKGEYCSNNYFYNDWTIDWQNKKLQCQNINNYQGIFEYLANRYRCFRINIDNKIINAFFKTQLRKIDRAFKVCEMIYDDVASKGVEVGIFSVSAQTSPAYTFKEYCAFKGKNKGMNFYFAINGYENYYTNLGTKVASTLAIENMTKNYHRRSPLIALRKDFEEWIKDGNTLDKYREEISIWLNKDRVGNQGILSPEAQNVWQRIIENKASGKKIIVVYGKVLCDLGVPYDGGPAHKDMYDWINHTIECARGANSLILIKPHPHEKKPEISRHLTEYLFDLIDVEVTENVVLLDNNWFSNHQLANVIDLAILWNGTSCLELGAKNIPLVMCAYFGKFDYPVDFYYPKSRKDYFNIIQGKKVIKTVVGNDLKCQLLLKYLKEELSVKYRYAPRPATNDPIGPPYWIEEDLKRYYNDNDHNVKILAEKFFQH
jgi:hypothetical protein